MNVFGNINLKNNLKVDLNASVGGSLDIKGATNMINLGIKNNLNVEGHAFILENTNIEGNLNVINTNENSVNLEGGANKKKYECIWKY